MVKPENNPNGSFWILGVAMMLPLALLSGPILGYLCWHFIGVRLLGLNSGWMFVFIALGLILSGIQVMRLIKRIQDTDTNQKK